MLISKLLCSILAIAPTLSSAHSIVIGAVGDADKSVKGHAIGMVEGTSRKDANQYSGLRDAAIFSFPTIPNKWCKKCVKRYKPKCGSCLSSCWKKKYGKKGRARRLLRRTNAKKKQAAKKQPAAKKKATAKKAKTVKKKTTTKKKKTVKAKAKVKAKKTGKCLKYIKNCKKCPVYDFNCAKCRTPLVNGCGRTFMVQQSPLYDIDSGAKAGKMCCGAKSPYYGLGSLNIQNWVNKMAQKNSIPKVRSGGYLELKIHQVNADGGGPYHCIVDKMGTGAQFDQTRLQIIGKNVPGKNGISKYKFKKWKLIVQMPTNLGCSGSYNGANNVCMVRCNNGAPNGPFGGCIPVQQVGGDPSPPPENDYPDPPEDEDVAGEEHLADDDNAYIQGKSAEQDDGSEETSGYGPVGTESEDDPDAVEEDDDEEEGGEEGEEGEEGEGGEEAVKAGEEDESEEETDADKAEE
ncbi:hypothetical protein EYR41_001129 [Orbilia oligospora]|uniref:Uncharacterized protein n=1 Tax=Orbilia oligospora TaxID=2813651 RepID=A0A8H2E9C3_ORBOL|nr:hypothetical protein EYR41_001129 [Orbilia oligospora]